MLRAMLLSLLVLATALPLTATASVDVCRDYYVCPIVRVQADPLLVCGGVGLGYQGVAACAYEDAGGHPCVRYVVGFRWGDLCDLISWDASLVLP